MRVSLSVLTGALFAASPLPAADPVRTGAVAELWIQNCASCHGDRLQGGSAPSMLDDDWTHGGDDASLATSIRQGYDEKGMPAWAGKLSDKQVRAIVIYIREQRAIAQRARTTFNQPADDVVATGELHRFILKTWIDDLAEPWALAFLPDGRALVTEKRGTLRMIDRGRLVQTPVRGLPAVDRNGQAGLFDIVLHPDFARNGWIYLAFSDPRKNDAGRTVSLTRVIRGRLRDGAFVDQQDIFRAPLSAYPSAGGVHFGGRLAFDRDGFLFFSIGERGHGPRAQDRSLPTGKIHRLHDDGRVPADNPFVTEASMPPSLWSYGHRNPQGLAIDPVTGDLWDAEHGPRGGDELNVILPGRNYGWPVITYGMNYDGTPMTALTVQDSMEQPAAYWTPSIAVCGINFYTGSLFPKWQNHLFVASLAAEELRRVEVRGRQIVGQEILFKNLGRIRHVITGPDGALYVLLPRRIARLSPAD